MAFAKSAGTDCPVCGHVADDLTELEVHVNSHFDTHGIGTSDSAEETEAVLENGSHYQESKEPTSIVNGNLDDNARGSCHPCPICGIELSNIIDLEEHVNNHLTEDGSGTFVPTKVEAKELASANHGTKRKQQVEKENGQKCPSKKIFIPPSWKDNLESRTTDVIRTLTSFHSSNCNSKLQLCNDCSHFSTHKMPDSGFGCGYRNLQIMLSCLSANPTFQTKVFQGSAFVPSIYRLQMLLEEAWSSGFDSTGAQQLNHKVTNTRKWIGATEVATILSHLKIRCQIYDFTAKSSGSVSHPRIETCVRSYFESENIWKSPLYLQHQGHSRAIIGFEEKAGSFHLVVLDPGMPKFKMGQMLKTLGVEQLKFGSKCLPANISLPLSSFTCGQYQIVAVLGLMESEREQEESKVLTSIKMS